MIAQEWVAILAPMDAWNERAIMAAFAVLGPPSNLLDVGCGTGAMVNLARRIGVEAVGVDQIGPLHGEGWLLKADLRWPLRDGAEESTVPFGPFGMVISLEVAEHIPPEYGATYCDTVASMVEEGGTLLFSSAHPGQGGEDHVNCRPASYWRGMFTDRGLTWNQELSLKVALAWSNVPMPMYWLPANVQVFHR